jgi:hypothetical protein
LNTKKAMPSCSMQGDDRSQKAIKLSSTPCEPQ